MSFETIIGNDKIKNLLQNSVYINHILHSYMFVGENGIGKFLFAKEFANMILCNNQDYSKKPCKICNSCTKFISNNHPDFMIISPDDNKSIKIEQIRYLRGKNF